jgi:hypothetical protein
MVVTLAFRNQVLGWPDNVFLVAFGLILLRPTVSPVETIPVVSTCVLICLVLLMDEFTSLIFIYRVFSSVETRAIPKTKETGSKVPSISHKKAHS